MRRLLLLTAMVSLLVAAGCGRGHPRVGEYNASEPPPIVRSAVDRARESNDIIGFLERKIQRDPGDADAYSRLAGQYLQQLRETGAFADLDLARRAARASLAIVPAVRNTDGLTALALAEFAAHDFGSARDHARELISIDDSGKSYALLGDALAELGNYGQAIRAYHELQRRSGDDENVATRLARLAQLRGDTARVQREFARALALERNRSEPSPERTAWFLWQLGDTAFFTGNVRLAQVNYERALTVYPDYFRAFASLGRLKAASSDFSGAAWDYEAALRRLPDPTFVGELGDVYLLAGRPRLAQQQYDLVGFIGHLSRLNGVMYNRQLAMFDADHDINATQAYGNAKREFEFRRDILGADALAWTALKAGKIHEAQIAIRAALRLGTLDPRLLYHAGMIALSAGQSVVAQTYLSRALALCPEFDPLQARKARLALLTLGSRAGRPALLSKR